ncbi:LAETG motif-containing sortase-dependent surface protein [Streptomyces catenulae]|uniref:LAETG motif-containing sortase-dependent surface protein n=1 Tax=Streptomyces catenulae TaxID=66875 RepID=A0ABV2YTS7_9ACTN|nr:LAETG motif-containing sortase-dependent surface protein [Streptomyces catenulae]
MTARRPLLTAAAAGSVLIALWFVPSAHAIVDAPETGARTTAATVSNGGTRGSDAVTADRTAPTPRPAGASAHSLAETGSPDTTPYVIGGAATLALGAGLVSYSVRRSHGGLP